MKILRPFQLRHTLPGFTLIFATLCTHPGNAQDNTGNKPEIAAPTSAPAPTMAEHTPGHKEKVPSATLTITLQSAHPVMLPAAGGSLSLGDKSLTLTPADISALPHESVTVVNGHTNATETYSGVSIAVLLARLGLPFEHANEHTLLKTYLVAEGTDNYRAIVSVYETLSTIRGSSAIVADSLDSKPLANDGAFKLIIPGDKRPQRWVQNLKSISFRTTE